VSYGDSATGLSPTAALGIAVDNAEFGRLALMKEYFVALVKRVLPNLMGKRYQKIVVNCLTCLDKENVDFEDESEFEDADGILVGVRCIERLVFEAFYAQSRC
jgi:hypothetical protein